MNIYIGVNLICCCHMSLLIFYIAVNLIYRCWSCISVFALFFCVDLIYRLCYSFLTLNRSNIRQLHALRFSQGAVLNASTKIQSTCSSWGAGRVARCEKSPLLSFFSLKRPWLYECRLRRVCVCMCVCVCVCVCACVCVWYLLKIPLVACACWLVELATCSQQKLSMSASSKARQQALLRLF